MVADRTLRRPWPSTVPRSAPVATPPWRNSLASPAALVSYLALFSRPYVEKSTNAIIATLQVLNGTISERGILAPMYPSLNNPLMKELKDNYGIYCKEKFVDF